MYINRDWKPRRRRKPWLRYVFLIALVSVALYWARQRYPQVLRNPFVTPVPTPTPTRTIQSWLADAELNFRAGHVDKTLAAYRHVTKLEPNNADVYAWLARLLTLRGDTEEALPLARKAVELEPNNATYLAVLAMVLDWNGKYEEALSKALEAVDLDPNNAQAHAYLAEIYADMGNWDRALEEAETAISLDDKDPFVWRNYGYVLEVRGEYRKAIDAYLHAAQLAPLAFFYIAAGRNYQALQEFDKAIELFQKARAIEPNNPAPQDAIGWAYFLAGDPQKAMVQLEKAIEIDPNYAPAYVHLGTVYYVRRNYEGAIEMLEKAVELGEARETVYYMLGLSYVYLDDCDKGVPWLRKALDLNPHSQPALQGLKMCGVTPGGRQ